jgi:hypothetical protein
MNNILPDLVHYLNRTTTFTWRIHKNDQVITTVLPDGTACVHVTQQDNILEYQRTITGHFPQSTFQIIDQELLDKIAQTINP